MRITRKSKRTVHLGDIPFGSTFVLKTMDHSPVFMKVRRSWSSNRLNEEVATRAYVVNMDSGDLNSMSLNEEVHFITLEAYEKE